MDSSVCQFDFDLRQLYRLKLRLDYQLKLMELRVLTIFRELLLLRQFRSRDVELQEKMKGCIQEEKSIMVKNQNFSSEPVLKVDQYSPVHSTTISHKHTQISVSRL